MKVHPGRKLALATVLAASVACHSTGTAARPDSPMAGAAAPRLAVESFLAAVRAQDLQAMSNVWGTEQGLARDQLDRAELEKRELIMQCVFEHDGSRIVDDSPSERGRRAIRVELTKGRAAIVRTFYVARGPSDRWYVADAEMSSQGPSCRGRQ